MSLVFDSYSSTYTQVGFVVALTAFVTHSQLRIGSVQTLSQAAEVTYFRLAEACRPCSIQRM